MTLKHLRTKTEKILFPVAIIFSALVWIAIIFFPFRFLIFPKTTDSQTLLSQACIFISDDKYEVITAEKAKEYGMESECLIREKIPDDVYADILPHIERISSVKKQMALFAEISVTYGILMYIFIFMFFFYFTAGLSMAHIRLNGIRLGPKQYGKFYEIYEETAKTLGMEKIPRAYVIHAGGTINAFAIKISRKKMIVFFAEVIEELVEAEKFDELRAVAAHELTHVRLKHVHFWFFLAPFRAAPFLSSWLSRARELSADRGAYFVCQNHETVSRALLKLVTGKTVAKEIDIEKYIRQLHFERGFFVMVSRLISSHPPMPIRIKAIQKLAHRS